MRAVVFANGDLNNPEAVRDVLQPQDLLIAADGGAKHLRALGLTPDILIGDFDSLAKEDLETLRAQGVELRVFPERKDFTDLELALQLAVELGRQEVLVIGALGARWDQTLANLLLPAAVSLRHVRIWLVDGPQELALVQAGKQFEITGRPGDTVSLIPLNGDAEGVETEGLEYPLVDEKLFFGSTRGISNVLVAERAGVRLRKGLLVCVVIHGGAQAAELGKLEAGT